MEAINQKLCIKIVKEALMRQIKDACDLSEVIGLIEEFFDEDTVILSESEMYDVLKKLIEDQYCTLCNKYAELDIPDYLDDIIYVVDADDYVSDRLYIEVMRDGLYRDYFDETECMMVYVEGEYYYVMFKEMV